MGRLIGMKVRDFKSIGGSISLVCRSTGPWS